MVCQLNYTTLPSKIQSYSIFKDMKQKRKQQDIWHLGSNSDLINHLPRLLLTHKKSIPAQPIALLVLTF